MATHKKNKYGSIC